MRLYAAASQAAHQSFTTELLKNSIRNCICRSKISENVPSRWRQNKIEPVGALPIVNSSSWPKSGNYRGNTKLAKYKVFAPFDSKLSVWMNPMFFLHAGQAERTWRELANDPQTMVCKHPGDFTLFQIGFFDDESGLLEPIHPAVQLMTAVAAKDSPPGELPLKMASL